MPFKLFTHQSLKSYSIKQLRRSLNGECSLIVHYKIASHFYRQIWTEIIALSLLLLAKMVAFAVLCDRYLAVYWDQCSCRFIWINDLFNGTQFSLRKYVIRTKMLKKHPPYRRIKFQRDTMFQPFVLPLVIICQNALQILSDISRTNGKERASPITGNDWKRWRLELTGCLPQRKPTSTLPAIAPEGQAGLPN